MKQAIKTYRAIEFSRPSAINLNPNANANPNPNAT
jgi:hypothetical protein